MNNGISVIVPFFNEEDCIEMFCQAYDRYASTLSFGLELILVNDGSTDSTLKKITGYEFKFINSVKIINLSKNFGSHAAIRAGLTIAKHDICTWMGCDLQEPLEILSVSYPKIANEGYDAVYVDKKTVKVSKLNRFFSEKYSRLMQKYAVSNYSDGGTSTIVFGKKIKDYLNANIENNSVVMLQIMNAGFKYFSISLDYGERIAGTSKWTLSKKIKLLIDSFVAFSFMPIRLVSIIGVMLFFIGMVVGITTIINKFVNSLVPVGYSTLVSVLALGFGITNISLGIIAEYLWRTFDAARNRPAFIISDEIIVKDEE